MLPLFICYEPITRKARLLVYDWERRRWPVERGMQITGLQAARLYTHLAGVFGIPAPVLSVRRGNGGGCYYLGAYGKPTRISLRKRRGVEICYGTAVHEFAHHVARYVRRAKVGHGKDFRAALERCYLAANTFTKAAI